MNLPDLTSRERVLVGVLGSFAAALVVYFILFGIRGMVEAQREKNQEFRTAIAKLQQGRSAAKTRQTKKDALTAKYSKKAPRLGGFIEQLIKDQELDPPEMQDKPDAPAGKKFTERTTTARFRKAPGLAMMKVFEKVEQSGFPMAITRLNIRKRSGDHDSYDVELGVSTYDRNEVVPSAAGSAAPAGTK